MSKKILAILLSVFMVIGILPNFAFAEELNLKFCVVTGNSLKGCKYSDEDHVLRIKSSGNYCIKGTRETKYATIEISAGCGKVDLTLDSVEIDISEKPDKAALIIKSNDLVKINLKGKNSLYSGENCAGLQKDGAGKLVIDGEEGSQLLVKGGDRGAGIGGCNGSAGVNIEINGGKIEAIGGICGAGIGGGNEGVGSNIKVAGGEIKATGEVAGAGIGGGNSSVGSNIIVTAGKVWATGGRLGAGIGGGGEGVGTDIEITGGEVKATGGLCGAGIGGGDSGVGSNITILGGRVEAIGGKTGAGIGGGDGGAGSDIKICGGNVQALSETLAAGIGGGRQGAGSNIMVTGGEVQATGGVGGAGIGGGYEGLAGSNITIDGGKIWAIGGENGAGIGGADKGSGSGLKITGGEINAKGGKNGAGIGGGNEGVGFDIQILGGKVESIGGENGAGIGGGNDGDGRKIQIISGKIVGAKGGKYAAGIGGGFQKGGFDITIIGKMINAVGGEEAVAIGGGKEGTRKNILYNFEEYTLTDRELINTRLNETDRSFIVKLNEDVSSDFAKKQEIDPSKINGTLTVPEVKQVEDESVKKSGKKGTGKKKVSKKNKSSAKKYKDCQTKINDCSGEDVFSNSGEQLTMRDVAGENLFSHVPNVCDVVQNDVGDCYFLSSLTAIVRKKPQIIYDAIVDNKDGTVTVRFFDISDETKEPVPCYYKIRKTVPEKYYKEGRIWVQLFEKAYVLHLKNTRRKEFELTHDYSVIKSGNVSNALREIVQGVKISEVKAITDISDDDFVCAGSRCDCQVDGIVSNHYYAVLGIVEEAGRKFFVLRNPYGENIPIYEENVLGEFALRKSEEAREGIFKLRQEEFSAIFNFIVVGSL